MAQFKNFEGLQTDYPLIANYVNVNDLVGKYYRGKVRDCLTVQINGEEKFIMIVSDRISAFDKVLPIDVAGKGAVLNKIADRFLDATRNIVPNWKEKTILPHVTAGESVEEFKIEMIVRGYLCGSLWRLYQKGEREICGLKLPDGMKENQAFPEPIVTPTTKADQGGHDENISPAEIVSQGLATQEEYDELALISLELYAHGVAAAAERGLIFVDTKYEFGKRKDGIVLIDEVNTPDSSRYWYLEGYQERFEAGEKQKPLSKEFVREWLMEQGFMGKYGQELPDIPVEKAKEFSDLYLDLFKIVTGETLELNNQYDVQESIVAYIVVLKN